MSQMSGNLADRRPRVQTVSGDLVPFNWAGRLLASAVLWTLTGCGSGSPPEPASLPNARLDFSKVEVSAPPISKPSPRVESARPTASATKRPLILTRDAPSSSPETKLSVVLTAPKDGASYNLGDPIEVAAEIEGLEERRKTTAVTLSLSRDDDTVDSTMMQAESQAGEPGGPWRFKGTLKHTQKIKPGKYLLVLWVTQVEFSPPPPGKSEPQAKTYKVRSKLKEIVFNAPPRSR